MSYDILTGFSTDKGENNPLTLGELMTDLANAGDLPVVFLDTQYTIGSLGSWRGSYDIPALTYDLGAKTGKQLFEQLSEELKETHYGYKGGEYKYSTKDTFYVSEYGCAQEFMVVKTEQEDGCLVLYTKIIPY